VAGPPCSPPPRRATTTTTAPRSPWRAARACAGLAFDFAPIGRPPARPAGRPAASRVSDPLALAAGSAATARGFVYGGPSKPRRAAPRERASATPPPMWPISGRRPVYISGGRTAMWCDPLARLGPALPTCTSCGAMATVSSIELQAGLPKLAARHGRTEKLMM
jgi:hypothetical protein